MFIGFYNYTVVLTYMSLLSSVVGMTEALDGRFGNAIACLVASGICDMLDGKSGKDKERPDGKRILEFRSTRCVIFSALERFRHS
ncbi:MAG: hypothetical protein V8S22_00985 [Lachnospiraceae bacterium]